jgi:membrane associated rhomboid family serine protease
MGARLHLLGIKQSSMHANQRLPLLSISLVVITGVAWFLVVNQFGLSVFQQQKSALLLQVGAVNGETLGNGQIWRLLTSQFLHVNFLHMVFNLIGIYLLASAIERTAGSTRLTFVYFGCGTVGQYASVLLRPELVSSGASQALMALCGFTLIAYWRLSLPKYVFFCCAAMLAVQVVLDLYFSGAIKPGHTFGFLAGLASAPLLFFPKLQSPNVCL